MAQLSVVGTDIPRIEGRGKVTGAARYSVDVTLPGLLWAKVLRGTEPHALITSIDTSEALALDGVRAIVTSTDLNGLLTGASIRDMPVLATDRVRFIGEPIAVVAADSAEIAEEAVTLIRVKYDVLPSALDAETAMQPSAPIIHPDRSSYPGAPDLPPTPNIQGFTRVAKGDVEDGFASADRIFEHTFRTASMHQGYIEPRASTVLVEADGTVRVWASCQAPYGLRNLLAKLLQLPPDQVIVETTPVGGSFGAKGAVGLEPALYALAKPRRGPSNTFPARRRSSSRVGHATRPSSP
jgi:CO/xanthine dehydrogenase Mo-binding subunit